MEAYTLALALLVAALFTGTAVYLHMLRKRSERVFPAPFVNPPGRRRKTGPLRKR